MFMNTENQLTEEQLKNQIIESIKQVWPTSPDLAKQQMYKIVSNLRILSFNTNIKACNEENKKLRKEIQELKDGTEIKRLTKQFDALYEIHTKLKEEIANLIGY